VSDKRVEFEALFRAHHAAVYRYVVRRVEGPAVQDIVAETFLIAWRRRDEVVGDPRPWLLGVARRTCANHLRAVARRAALGERLTAQPAPFSVAAGLADRSLGRALASLAPGDREALLLVAWDELSNREAARVLRCSPGAFAVRLHRARRRLAQALRDQDANALGTSERPPERMSADAH
jgi:RNA polymerase sigma-70 factor, ECF subfamily